MNDSVEEIKKLWTIFAVSHSSVLELRALSPTGLTPPLRPITMHFRVKDYGNRDECMRTFEQEALKLNAQGYNVYIVMNPIVESFSGKAVSDADIEYRDLILIDIDRAGAKREPATDEEVNAAKELAERVAQYTDSLGWSAPLRVMSGNGYHLYFVLRDVPNNDAATREIQLVLRSLAAKFDNDIVKIDTAVFNASRITKVPGTIMRKGVESEGRPFRMAVVV